MTGAERTGVGCTIAVAGRHNRPPHGTTGRVDSLCAIGSRHSRIEPRTIHRLGDGGLPEGGLCAGRRRGSAIWADNWGACGITTGACSIRCTGWARCNRARGVRINSGAHASPCLPTTCCGIDTCVVGCHGRTHPSRAAVRLRGARVCLAINVESRILRRVGFRGVNFGSGGGGGRASASLKGVKASSKLR